MQLVMWIEISSVHPLPSKYKSRKTIMSVYRVYGVMLSLYFQSWDNLRKKEWKKEKYIGLGKILDSDLYLELQEKVKKR